MLANAHDACACVPYPSCAHAHADLRFHDIPCTSPSLHAPSSFLPCHCMRPPLPSFHTCTLTVVYFMHAPKPTYTSKTHAPRDGPDSDAPNGVCYSLALNALKGAQRQELREHLAVEVPKHTWRSNTGAPATCGPAPAARANRLLGAQTRRPYFSPAPPALLHPSKLANPHVTYR